MEVDVALLCDAVTIREGLFHILGGGITFVGRPSYPAPLVSALALRVSMHRTEANRQHPLTVIVQGDDGQELAKIEGAFAPNPTAIAALEAGEELFTCIAIPIGQAELPAPGRYSVEVLVDGVHKKSVAFTARLV